MANVPHLDLPFRWERYGGDLRAAEVEQNTVDEIAVCVEAILRTPYEWRDERADFGRPDQLFEMNPDDEFLERLLTRQEDRLPLYVGSEIDPIDIALRRIGVSIGEND